jgi:hypothetical protein
LNSSNSEEITVNRQKKIFLGFAVVFLLLLAYASYDISTKTTFPGSKGQLKERIDKGFGSNDTISSDSAQKIKKY